jgi:hypothetical protein
MQMGMLKFADLDRKIQANYKTLKAACRGMISLASITHQCLLTRSVSHTDTGLFAVSKLNDLPAKPLKSALHIGEI